MLNEVGPGVQALLILARDAIVALREKRAGVREGPPSSDHAEMANVKLALDELDELDFPTSPLRASIQVGELQTAIEQLEQASIRVRFTHHDMSRAGDALFASIPVDGSQNEQHERRLVGTLIEMLSSIPRWPTTEAELGSGRKGAAHRVAGYIGANKPALRALVDEWRSKLPLAWQKRNADEVLGRLTPHAWHVVPLGYRRGGSIRARQRSQWNNLLKIGKTFWHAVGDELGQVATSERTEAPALIARVTAADIAKHLRSDAKILRYLKQHGPTTWASMNRAGLGALAYLKGVGQKLKRHHLIRTVGKGPNQKQAITKKGEADPRCGQVSGQVTGQI